MSPRIRLAVPNQDAVQIAEIYGPFCVGTPVTFELDAPNPGEMRGRIEQILTKLPWLVCEMGDQLLGYAYGAAHRQKAAYQWSVEVSIYVGDRYRRQGVGQALYTSLLSILANQGFCNAYAGITLPNQPSVALHQSFGFQPIGTYSKVGFKLGKWHDVGWWELMLRPRPNEPDSPIDLPLVIRLPQWTSHLERGVALLRFD